MPRPLKNVNVLCAMQPERARVASKEVLPKWAYNQPCALPGRLCPLKQHFVDSYGLLTQPPSLCLDASAYNGNTPFLPTEGLKIHFGLILLPSVPCKLAQCRGEYALRGAGSAWSTTGPPAHPVSWAPSTTRWEQPFPYQWRLSTIYTVIDRNNSALNNYLAWLRHGMRHLYQRLAGLAAMARRWEGN